MGGEAAPWEERPHLSLWLLKDQPRAFWTDCFERGELACDGVLERLSQLLAVLQYVIAHQPWRCNGNGTDAQAAWIGKRRFQSSGDRHGENVYMSRGR
jgi:hypothetical protein